MVNIQKHPNKVDTYDNLVNGFDANGELDKTLKNARSRYQKIMDI